MLKGFTTHGVDVVLKVGGSLLSNLPKCRRLMEDLGAIARDGMRILLVPGGGPPDKAIEAINAKLPLSLDTCHRACALAQDQVGLILADPAFTENAVATTRFSDLPKIFASRSLGVLLPSKLIFAADPIERTWEVTSDSVGAWVAWLSGARRFAVLTDVDGIYVPGRIGNPEFLMKEINCAELIRLGNTSVDACLPYFLRHYHITCAVLNGYKSDGVIRWLKEGAPPEGTTILP